MNLEQAVKDLQDNLIVPEIERRQSALLREHSEILVRIDARLDLISDRMDRVSERVDRLSVTLEGMGGKLNALIHVMDGIIRNKPPQ